MSAYSTLSTIMNNQGCLVKALQRQFPAVESFSYPADLIDWHGKVRPQKAQVIVRRKHVGGAANDIGFVKNLAGNFDAIISANEMGGKYKQSWLDSLAETYMEERATELMTDNDCELAEREVTSTGHTVLKYRVNA